jgi:transcriptional regulator with XRE-family HTH domain
MNQEALGRRLRALRAKRGLSLRDVERETGVDKHTVSYAERGVRSPIDRTLGKLATLYGVDVEELLFVEEEEQSAPADIAPKLTKEQFVAHGIEPTSAEMATLNALLEVYTEMSQSGDEGPRTFTIPEGPVDMERVHMLAYYAARSGILTQEDLHVIDTGVRTKLAAGAS